MMDDPTQPPKSEAELMDLLEAILNQHPDGIREYDLVQHLKKNKIEPFFSAALSDDLTLFKIHFLLFHLLYKLRNRLHILEKNRLKIHCLEIILQPWNTSTDSLPDLHDPLSAYYLNADNLDHTTQSDVKQMLDDFWKRFQNHLHKDTAWHTLGLEPGTPNEQIKSRYRDLAKKHHPDHGGCRIRFQEIAEAAHTLLAG
ncbi:MAG: DnaJ domain-containing protein [Magnetococcales bacterium]|nr:DnaJ domain-containing protein [Magnetococcales bacterium]